MPRKKTISDDELLAVARSVFVEHGFGASTKEIARRAGVSEGVLFQRFPTKAELFFASMVPPALDLSARLTLRHPPEQLKAALDELGLVLLDYFRLAEPVLEPLMAHPAFRFEEFAARHPDSPLVALRWQLVRFFALNAAPDPSAAALLWFATARSIASFERLGAHGGQFPREMVVRAFDALWHGVRPGS